MTVQSFRFGPFEINRAEKLLRRGGAPVALPPKTIETLLVLVQTPGQVVAKAAIMQAVWPDVAVEENNLTQQISILRKVLGHGAIQTVPKRGYRFTASLGPAVRPRLPLILSRIVVGIALIILLASFATRPNALAVAREPNTGAAVIGSIEHDQDGQLITIELVDARGNRSRWSRTTPDMIPRHSRQRPGGTAPRQPQGRRRADTDAAPYALPR